DEDRRRTGLRPAEGEHGQHRAERGEKGAGAPGHPPRRHRPALRWWRLWRPPEPPQLGLSFAVVLTTAPFGPTVRTSAFLASPQRVSPLVISPFEPPARSSLKLVTGASGTAWNVVRSAPPFTESTTPTRTMWICPSRLTTRFGSPCEEERR